MTFVVATTVGIEQVTTREYRQKSRLGAFAHDSGLLLAELRDRNGQPLPAMSDRDFGRKWRRRVRTVTDERTGRAFELEADPARVRAAWAVEGPVDSPVRGRTP
jgi:hypothetical protein